MSFRRAKMLRSTCIDRRVLQPDPDAAAAADLYRLVLPERRTLVPPTRTDPSGRTGSSPGFGLPRVWARADSAGSRSATMAKRPVNAGTWATEPAPVAVRMMARESGTTSKIAAAPATKAATATLERDY